MRVAVLAGALVAGAVLGGAGAAPAHTGPARAARLTLETLIVSNTSPKPVFSSTVLRSDRSYRLTASGTISDWCPEGATLPDQCSLGAPLGAGVDALYCYATWRCPKPELWRQLQVNDRGLDEFGAPAGRLPYSRTHIYEVVVTGVSGRLKLFASDAVGSSSDNSGEFTVELEDLGPKSGVTTLEVGWAQGGDRKGSRFVPSGAIVRSGATIRFCNRTDRVHEAFSRSRYNELELGRLGPGKCKAVKVQNPTRQTIEVRFRDSGHPIELLVLRVLPARG